MGVKVKIQDRDHGYKALVDRVFGFERPQISVGIVEADGELPKEPHEGEKSQPGLTVLQVAEWMEFGFHHHNGDYEVLPRSFVRAWFDSNEPELRELIARLMQSVLAGKRTKDQILELIGQWAVAGMQKRISEGIDPPLAESTIRKKGSSTPLVDSGQLRASISYKITQ